MLERVKAPTPIPWLLLVGNASYAIYLVHNPVVSFAVRLGAMLNASWELAFILCVLSGLLAGWAYHILVETPGLRLAGRLRLTSLGLRKIDLQLTVSNVPEDGEICRKSNVSAFQTPRDPIVALFFLAMPMVEEEPRPSLVAF